MQPNTNTHPLDQAVALRPGADNQFTGSTSDAYQNMVGPFGGVIAATLLNGVLQHPALQGQPVAQTVHFTAPIADGEFLLTARPMRTNRSTQHWLVELIQNDQVAAYATAITAHRRDTWQATDAQFPTVPAAEDVAVSEPPALGWTANYEMRFVDGGFGGPSHPEHPSLSHVWLRDRPDRPLDFTSLSALCDAFFPRIFLRRQERAPIGTVTLTSYFHADADGLRAVGTKPVLGVARGLNYGQGFFDQSAEVWSDSGMLLASSHQMVYFKA